MTDLKYTYYHSWTIGQERPLQAFGQVQDVNGVFVVFFIIIMNKFGIITETQKGQHPLFPINNGNDVTCQLLLQIKETAVNKFCCLCYGNVTDIKLFYRSNVTK